jgi:hypothetical protein
MVAECLESAATVMGLRGDLRVSNKRERKSGIVWLNSFLIIQFMCGAQWDTTFTFSVAMALSNGPKFLSAQALANHVTLDVQWDTTFTFSIGHGPRKLEEIPSFFVFLAPKVFTIFGGLADGNFTVV